MNPQNRHPIPDRATRRRNFYREVFAADIAKARKRAGHYPGTADTDALIAAAACPENLEFADPETKITFAEAWARSPEFANDLTRKVRHRMGSGNVSLWALYWIRSAQLSGEESNADLVMRMWEDTGITVTEIQVAHAKAML